MCVLSVLILTGFCLAQAPNLEPLIRQLGDEDFETREKATRLLEEQGEVARPLLSKAASESKDAEIRKRAEDLLALLDRKAVERAVAERTQALKQLKTPGFDPQRLQPRVEKKGVLADKEIWTPDRTYHLTANTTLARGAEVLIQPGTVIVLEPNVDLFVQAGAKLRVPGEPERPVIFTSQAETQGQPGHWGTLRIASSSVTLSHVQIRRSAGVWIEGVGSDRSIQQVGIYQTQGTGLTVKGSVRELGDLLVREATGTGLVVEGAYPKVGRVILSRCQTGAVFKGGAYPTLTDLNVTDCAEDGILVQDGSYPTLEKCIVLETKAGFRVEGGAYPRVSSLLIGSVRGDGMRIEGGSYPSLADVEVAGADGVGLRITGGSYPYAGVLKLRDCKMGNQEIEPGSRLQPLRLERLRPGG